MRQLVLIGWLAATVSLFACRSSNSLNETKIPVDAQATGLTINLYNNLFSAAEKGIMFGHQDALAYGIHWRYVDGQSDVKLLTGEYPAVYGWDLGHIELEGENNLDGVPFQAMKQFIIEAYERGGVNTISWHNRNPLTGNNAWDTTPGSVKAVLPGGSRHDTYKHWLTLVGDFMNDLKNKEGEYIPILFRPYHELTGHWFWWCKNNADAESFKELWKFTFHYLKDTLQVHHLLYVYNTADFKSRQEFLEYYPGDQYVDMLSFDAYQYTDPAEDSSFQNETYLKFSIIDSIAREKQKLIAFGETGYETIPYAEWWTKVLLPSMGDFPVSYVLLWRNHGLKKEGHMHYYVPDTSDVSAGDFKLFYQHPKTLFESDAKALKLYQ